MNQHGVTGFLVPPQNPAALAKALNKLLDNPSLREEMGEVGRKRVEKEFTDIKMAEGVLNVYERVLNS